MSEIHNSHDISTVLRQMSLQDDDEWRAREIQSVVQLEDLHNRGVVFRDGLAQIAEELAEYEAGKEAPTSAMREEGEHQLLESSRLMYLPWRNTVVRYPGSDDHFKLRTARNRSLVTSDEQRKLYEDVRPAVFGLSVGSNIVDSLSQAGIGSAYLLADYDRLAPTNLNRIRAAMADIGLRKTTIAGRKLTELDPSIEQTHLTKGYEVGVTDQALREWQPSIIFDEVDDLAIKAMLRRIAAESRVPLVMVGDVGDNAVVDVERYDLNDNQRPFNGKVSADIYERLLRNEELTADDRLTAIVGINGLENISERLIMSVGDPLLSGTVPQLGSTATRGAALAERITRSIALRPTELQSGTYIDNPNTTLSITPLQ